MTTKKLPTLNPAILRDSASLGEAIDSLVRDDRRMQLHVREILHRQRELQKVANDEAWEAYLFLETAVNARDAALMDRIAKWGFEQGREFERARRR